LKLSLGELLSENPNGLLLNRDELSGFLMSLEKVGHECDRSCYLESWNGDGRFTYDRIGRGTVEIESACLSIIGTIQPGPLSRYLRDALIGGKGDDGFIQRFQLAVYPDSPKSFQNIDRYPDTQAKDKAYEVFTRLGLLTAESVGAIPEDFEAIPSLRFSADAQHSFNEWLADLENRLIQQECHPALEAHLAKYRSLVPSLALLIHLIDSGAGSVNLQALQRACAWAEYLESHAQRIYATGLASDVYLAESLLSHIKKGQLPNPFTVRDIQRHNWSGLTTNQDVRAALDVLEEADILCKITAVTKGRPREDYFINPAIAQEGGHRNG
jgi:putative DNA primase/helicase